MPYYRRNVYILSVTVFLASLSWQQVMPFLSDFLKELGAGKQLFLWTGIVFAVQSLAAIIMQPLWGKMGDTHGRKPMIIRAGLCLAGVYFGMSLCHSPIQLAVCRFLNGALTGFIPGSFALIATNTPEEEAPKSMATVQAASNVGLIIGPVIGTVLASLLSYRGSMVVSGVAVMISTGVVWWLVQEPNKVVLVEKTSLIQDFGIAFRSRVQLALLFVVALTWAYGAAIAPYLIRHLRSLGGDVPHVLRVVLSHLHMDLPAVVFALPALAFVVSARAWTQVGSKRGYNWTMLIGLAGGGIGAIALFGVHDIWLFGAIYFITGVCTATLGPSVAAVTCTKVDEAFRGRAYGIQQSVGTLGSLISPLIAGFVGKQWGTPAIFLFVGTLFLGGSVVFRGLTRHWQTEGAQITSAKGST